MKGWIKLHRKLLDNPTMRNPAYLAVWVNILLRVDHDGSEKVSFHGKQVALKPGQFTTGAYQLAQQTGVARGTVERILRRFKSEERISIESDRQCSMITVLNWSQYQEKESKSEERTRNDRGTSEERVRTNQEAKKPRSKEVKNTEPDLATPEVVAEKTPNVINEVLELFQMKINPAINYGNKTQRDAVQKLLTLLGREKLIRTIEYTASIQNEEFAPTITTPYQLQEKLAQLTSYYQKKTNKPSNVISV